MDRHFSYIKKILLRCLCALVLTLFVSGLQAQDTLPDFNLQLSNGRYFTQADLPKNKPVVLIYFAPDCDHCHTLLNAFFQRANEFQPATVLLVTFKPLAEVTAFERAYRISKYPHIMVGTEGVAQSLRRFYKLQRTPFTALYNKEGKLVASYRKETPIDALLQQVKKL
ncbi:MAG: redoxin domain-containing protein [Chitinophagaceae bacterium]|nr:MAG: redoxin domain-containing protein [Chitinophagaceae bacterium]